MRDNSMFMKSRLPAEVRTGDLLIFEARVITSIGRIHYRDSYEIRILGCAIL
jgi:hypothetical protein